MLKLCGCKENCFVSGEYEWGHLGNIICKYASEDMDNQSICLLTVKRVHYYSSLDEYEFLMTLKNAII
jgi:hypothetical protein